MSVRSELVFQYDHTAFVVSATCSVCGEGMSHPPSNVRLPRSRALWFAKRFLEHKKQRHFEGHSEVRKAS
jgi:hypothetical protein